MSLPAKFAERILRDLGNNEGTALCEALDGESPVSVRLNPAKCAVARDAVIQGVVAPCDGAALLLRLGAAERIPWSTEGWYLAARPLFTLDAAFHAGAYYVQEASSQFVGHLLAQAGVQGARILDLCAAPGGKTTLYASLVGAEGLVVANEIDRRRAQVLADNVRKWGMANVAVTTCEPRMLGDFEQWFDVVAVDAPCSGEGMFRKDAGARDEWSEANVKMCAVRQDEILREAWRALKPGGRLLYSTCTFNRDEDEGTLERMLAWAGEEVVEADDVVINDAWGVVVGRIGVFQTFHFYPHKARGEGFFAAIARKAIDVGGRTRTPKSRRTIFTPVRKSDLAELSRWVAEPEQMRFSLVADTLYAWPVAQMDAVRLLAEALPVIYSGVAMGQVFKGKLKPDPALAFFVGLNREAVAVTNISGEEVLRYLRKQEVDAAPFVEGMNLVCVEGYAVGFVKRIGTRVNNLYPNSLRIIKQ